MTTQGQADELLVMPGTSTHCVCPVVPYRAARRVGSVPWIWNEGVARSKRAHGEGGKCGRAALDRMLTEARRMTPWLREGSSVAERQLIRDFGTSRRGAVHGGGLGMSARGGGLAVCWLRFGAR
jgi:hypothetical protein